ncbi:potassium channel family protein [Natrinema gari]|uniref:K+ transporter, NAD-binding protein n=1 Tax=Natrinema gari JCM 14663 TaxID=1230459 RepID=L9ZA68_9EURY|nr:TrkA family potassium uptake protein [Natrinema gari]ELY82891.1 k+ transporter, NAD-binding protein [Natrinema gari JCM 14663]
MHVIIVGAGGIGTPLIDIDTRSGNEVVVIERDDQRASTITSEYDCLVLNTDATTKSSLIDAGGNRADALISTTDRDATNIMVCLLAAGLEVPGVVSVVHNPQHMGIFERIGVNTIENPQRLIAEYLYRAVKRPTIVDYMRIGDRPEVFEIDVGPDAPIADRTLHEAGDTGLLGGDVLIVAIERDGEGEPITPRGTTRIRSGDRLTVYSETGAMAKVTDVFGQYEGHGNADLESIPEEFCNSFNDV